MLPQRPKCCPPLAVSRKRWYLRRRAANDGCQGTAWLDSGKCMSLAREERQQAAGFPFLAVLDGDGKIVTAQRTEPLEEGKAHDPARVKDFLGRWVAPRADARLILEAALAQVATDDKRVFLHFGAPWCGWCHRLEDFLARAEIAAILGPDFLDAKIDVDRMDNSKDVLATYRNGKAGGIPWFVIVDSKG